MQDNSSISFKRLVFKAHNKLFSIESLDTIFNDDGEYEFVMENSISDYIIRIEDKIIKCHKNILRKIDYFDKLFSNDWIDRNENIIENFQYNVVLDMIKYTYDEKYELDIEYFYEYIELADFLCYSKFNNALPQIRISDIDKFSQIIKKYQDFDNYFKLLEKYQIIKNQV